MSAQDPKTSEYGRPIFLLGPPLKMRNGELSRSAVHKALRNLAQWGVEQILLKHLDSSRQGEALVTGKCWPHIWEISLVPLSSAR